MIKYDLSPIQNGDLRFALLEHKEQCDKAVAALSGTPADIHTETNRLLSRLLQDVVDGMDDPMANWAVPVPTNTGAFLAAVWGCSKSKVPGKDMAMKGISKL